MIIDNSRELRLLLQRFNRVFGNRKQRLMVDNVASFFSEQCPNSTVKFVHLITYALVSNFPTLVFHF